MSKIILKKDNLPQKAGWYFVYNNIGTSYVSVYWFDGHWRAYEPNRESFLIALFPDALWSDEVIVSQE